MALTDFQMPSFEDPDGTKYVWDSASKSYVKVPLTDGRPDQSHATGGDNDLFDPFQHTEMSSVPELEGYMASTQDEPPFAGPDEVKCPNCGEVGKDQTCRACGKDLTPEWNVQGQQNEFFDSHPDFNDANEFWTWPQNVPKKNELNYDDSFPSMSLSKVAAEPALWDDIFSDAVPMRTEIGKWIMDTRGQLHFERGMAASHEALAQRDGLQPTDQIALGSVYNDGTADVQKVYSQDYLDLDHIEQELQRVFGPVELHPPVGLGLFSEKGEVFVPFDIMGGQWFVPPHSQTITGTAWVRERPNGVQYQPNMILVVEHLREEDFELWTQGVAAIITAVGGASSHAAYLAMTSNIPVIVGIGDSYNKLETGNYVKIDPQSETIAVMPGATHGTLPEQKQQIWNNILDYQRQRGGSVKQPQFSHIIEELDWKAANSPNLEDCPECAAPMVDQGGESVCHDCGHKQPIIIQAGAALALPAAEAIGGAAEGAGAASGGIGGIGGLMTKALRPGFGMGYAMGRGHGGGDTTVNVDGGGAPAAPEDPNIGVVSKRYAAWNARHAGALSAIFESLLNAAKSGAGALGHIDPSSLTRLINPLDPVSPLSYIDDAAIGGLGATHQQLTNQLQQATAALGDDDEDNVGLATKNDGTNSTEDASNSGTEGKKEQGDGPEQLKDVDGGHDSQDSASGDNLGDPHLQDKALKAFHMNLPLVIEFADSDEAGADHPILQALDALLEEAFPGYKDGFDDEAGAETEHPQEESETPEERDEDADKPDAKSEGADKKESAKIASVWHYAALGPESMPYEKPTQFSGEGDPYSEYDLDPDVGSCPDCRGSGEDLTGRSPDGLCPTCRGTGRYMGDVGRAFDRSALGAKTATLDPQQQSLEGFGVPAGAGGPAIQICPRCGQAHPLGTPCPVADVTTPLVTGDPTAQASPATHVVTKWHLAVPANMPVSVPQQNAGAPAAPTTCPTCGCNHLPGTPCPTSGMNQMTAPAAGSSNNLVSPPVGPGVAYSSTAVSGAHFALFDDVEDGGEEDTETPRKHNDDHHDDSYEDGGDYHSEDDWVDDSGQPLQEGADYEMKSAASPVPDRVTIEQILPEKLVYVIHSGDIDFRDTVTRDQLDLDGITFSAVNWNDTGEDSTDVFPGEEMPVRPGQDALPQEDDLSSPSTALSHFEPVSLENYTGSFQGDKVDGRSWLLEGGGGSAEVDPALMAKFAGKDFSPREQREFIDEKGEARNLDRLDLSGTHYIDDDLHTNDTLW